LVLFFGALACVVLRSEMSGELRGNQHKHRRFSLCCVLVQRGAEVGQKRLYGIKSQLLYQLS